MKKKQKKISFGRGLTSVEGSSWKFDSNVAQSFDKHVRQSIPHYDSIQKYICSMSEWFIKKGSLVYDLGCSTGETAKNICEFSYNRKVNFKFIGIDNTKQMISIAKLKVKKPYVKFKCQDINKIKNFRKSDLFISILLFPFLNLKKRKKILKKIYKSLNTGGALIFIDKINSNNSKLQDMFNQIYFDFKIDNKLTKTQILNKAKSLRGSMSIFQEEEIKSFCKHAGFKKIDTFFRWFNFVGIIALK
tara:strand:- start:15 stop:752 length:738 start_codon:yes stop_codon:yes gene_type:complete